MVMKRKILSHWIWKRVQCKLSKTWIEFNFSSNLLFFFVFCHLQNNSHCSIVYCAGRILHIWTSILRLLRNRMGFDQRQFHKKTNTRQLHHANCYGHSDCGTCCCCTRNFTIYRTYWRFLLFHFGTSHSGKCIHKTSLEKNFRLNIFYGYRWLLKRSLIGTVDLVRTTGLSGKMLSSVYLLSSH